MFTHQYFQSKDKEYLTGLKKKKKQDPIYMFLRDSLALRTHINREVAKNIPCIKGKKKAGIPILISDKSD